MSEAEAIADAPKGNRKALIRAAVEFGPVATFFISYYTFGIMAATAIFMVVTVAALSFAWLTERRIAPMPLVSGVIVMVFGGLTLWLQDETFIKMKPTIVNLLYASILLGGLAFGQLFFKYLFSAAYRLPDYAWRMLTIRWSLFFVFLAVLNELIWRNFSTDFWVNFKFFGNMPIVFVFALAQIPYVTKHTLPDEEEAERAPDNA